MKQDVLQLRRVAGTGEVRLLRWPHEADRRAELAEERVPRLLLVDDDAPPPECADCLEDWIRLPAHDADLDARIDQLLARSRSHRPTGPQIDDHGVVRCGDLWISLPPVEADLAQALIASFGRVVRRDELLRFAWPDSAPLRNCLDVHILRLRRRLAPLGLGIRTVRNHGYVLEAAGRETAGA